MCGAVRFDAQDVPTSFNACACDMCRRLTGSCFFSVWMPLDKLKIDGTEHINTFDSSDWAKRAFCGNCGSVLWYQPVEGDGHVGLSLGLFDAPGNMEFGAQYFCDKPICTTVAQAPDTAMTEAETIAYFTGRAS